MTAGSREPSELPPDTDVRSWSRHLARWSVLAAFFSCSLNCVFNQLTARAAAVLGRFDAFVGWGSLLLVLAGMALGASALVGGWRSRSADTMVIALIGLILNGGIVFVVVWYFAAIRP
jgi:hypothetical protein